MVVYETEDGSETEEVEEAKIQIITIKTTCSVAGYPGPLPGR